MNDSTLPDYAEVLSRRLVSDHGGGFVTMAFVATERLFSREIWPQLFSIHSAICGKALHRPPFRARHLSGFPPHSRHYWA